MMPETPDARQPVTAEEVADAALAWLWMSRQLYPPSGIDRTGYPFRDVCRRMGGKYLEAVHDIELAEDQDRRGVS